jgi:hypothetical protein
LSGLTCYTAVPGGYCTKTCASHTECGSGAYCYATTAGNACLRACAGNTDCRTGYTCQGDPGIHVCYPNLAAGTDGGTGTGTCTEAWLLGNWGYCGSGAYCEQLTLRANHTADYTYWQYLSGNMYSYGTWSLSCPTLTVTLTSGYYGGSTYTWTVAPNGIFKDSVRFGRCTGACF